jgi:hypothetical protein
MELLSVQHQLMRGCQITKWQIPRVYEHICGRLLTYWALLEKLPIVQQELPSILRNPKFHYRVHKSPPLVPIHIHMRTLLYEYIVTYFKTYVGNSTQSLKWNSLHRLIRSVKSNASRPWAVPGSLSSGMADVMSSEEVVCSTRVYT